MGSSSLQSSPEPPGQNFRRRGEPPQAQQDAAGPPPEEPQPGVGVPTGSGSDSLKRSIFDHPALGGGGALLKPGVKNEFHPCQNGATTAIFRFFLQKPVRRSPSAVGCPRQVGKKMGGLPKENGNPVPSRSSPRPSPSLGRGSGVCALNSSACPETASLLP